MFRKAIPIAPSLALLLAACSDNQDSLVATTQPEVAAQVVEATAETAAVPVGQLGRGVEPKHYRIELKVDPTETHFAGEVEIDVEFATGADVLWLHGKGLEMEEAWLSTAGGRVEAGWEQVDPSGVAKLSLARVVNAGQATLHFRYRAPFNNSTKAMFKVVRGEDAYAATQFEPDAARQVFPGFDDPGFKVPFDLSLTVREGMIAITSTPESGVEPAGDGWVRHRFETTRPLPTYLLAFAVGPYDVVDYGMIPANEIREREVRLRGIAARGLGERMAYALENTPGILTELEQYFGIPLPYKKLDLIAVPEGFGGAMENVGAITYDEYLMLMDENSPLQQRRVYTYVHAHELAHQWFGNLVTPTWWNDIWLNEAFASWMHYKIADAYWPEGEFDRETLGGALNAMSNDSLASARQIREPVEHNDQISGAFDGITYLKGGGVLAMLERYVGEEAFRDGVRRHMEKHADGTADAEDFIASLAEGSGRPEITDAFLSFIEQPGVPLVTLRVDCAEGRKARLQVSQGRYAPLGSAIDGRASQWQVPMCVSYASEDGPGSQCELLKESEQTIELDTEACPSQIHPNADGAGYYRFDMDESWWSGLITAIPGMPAAEALVMGDSLDAAFRAGTVSSETYLAGMAALVNHPSWDVADASAGLLEVMGLMIEPEQSGVVDKAYSAIAKPRYAALDGESGTGADLLRQRLQRFLIVIARNPEMRAPLARQAAARIGLDGEPDPKAVAPGQLETVLSIGVQDIGEPFFDLLLTQLIASEDPAFRSAASGALARAEDPALVRKLQAAWLEDGLKGTERVSMVQRQMIRAATTDLTFQWILANEEAALEMIPENFRSRVVPGLGSSFCSLDDAARWRTFVESHAGGLPGYERPLAQALESIELCAGLRSARQEELLEALSVYY